MLFILQLVTILVMLAATYVIFKALGPRRESLLYSRKEKADWDERIARPLGGWLTVTNITGTLTSLATAYLFFIGNSKVFGYWIAICALSIFLGAFVTNFFTRRLAGLPRIRALLETNEQNAAVIARLFWSDDPAYRRTTSLVKYVSMASIISVIWLEFSLFADVSGQLLSIDSLVLRSLMLAVVAVFIIDFTIRYGLRGFVFADAFHAPLIAFAILILFTGCVALVLIHPDLKNFSLDWCLPVLPLWQCILFAVHVLCLNVFLVLSTEPHWLRVWAFGHEKVTQLQVRSLLGTAVVWLLMSIVGFLAYGITQEVGDAAIPKLILALFEFSPAFVVVFWVGAIAALFSTADTQLYAALLVNEFNPQTGELKEKLMSALHPFRTSLFGGCVFAVFYFLVRYFDIPFEKIVFIIVPLCLNLLPAFVLAARRARQHPAYIAVSMVLYLVCATVGFMLPEQQFSATLAAGLMPILVSVVAYFIAPSERELEATDAG